MQKKDTTGRKSRLKQFHYNAGRRLRLIDTGHIKTLHGNRQSITYRLRKLAEAAGVSRKGLDNEAIYLAAIRAFIQAGKGDDHPHATGLRETLERIKKSVLNDPLKKAARTAPASHQDKTRDDLFN